MENSDDSLDSIFSTEQRVQVLIEAVVMVDGFITYIDRNRKNNRKLWTIQVADWVGYLASKIAFEKNYDAPTPAALVMTDAGATVTDGTTNLSYSNTDNTSNTNIRKDYFGTYVKDVWSDVCRASGMEWFGDADKKLSFFTSGSKILREGGGNAYLLKDAPSAATGEIMVKMDYDYNFKRDATYKFNNLKVLNGQTETIPSMDIHHFQTHKKILPTIGSINTSFNYVYGDQFLHPATFEAGPTTGEDGDTPIPAVGFTYGSNPSESLFIQLGFVDDISLADYANLTGITVGKYERVKFYMYYKESGQTTEKILLKLVDGDDVTNYYYRDILPDLTSDDLTSLSTGGWVWLDYPLPTGISLSNPNGPATDNGWQKSKPNETIDNIDFVEWRWTPSQGWASDTTVKFSSFFFWRRQNVTLTTSNTPQTTKLIVLKDELSKDSMTDYANKEFPRTVNEYITASGTIEGNTDFKSPGYLVVFDYDSTLGSTSLAALKMQEIIHRVHLGRYTTTISGVTASVRV